MQVIEEHDGMLYRPGTRSDTAFIVAAVTALLTLASWQIDARHNCEGAGGRYTNSTCVAGATN